MAHKGAWIKVRREMSKYPETPQQKKVKVGGELIRRLCKGKKGKGFMECRSKVLQCAFDDDKCKGELLTSKREAEEMLNG